MHSTIPSSPRASVWEWAQAILLSANLGWTTLGRGGYLPRTMVVTAALTCTLLALHLGARLMDGGRTRERFHPAGWLLVPFLIYAALNVVWLSPVPWLGWFDWFGWVQMAVVFWVVLNGIRHHGPRRFVFAALLLTALACVVLGCYQRFVKPDWLMLGAAQAEQYRGRASGPFGNPNSLAAVLILLLPAVGALAFRGGARETERVWWGWLLLVFLLGLFLTVSRGPWIGLMLALAAWPLFGTRGRWMGRVVGATLVLLGVILGGAVLFEVSPHARERFSQLLEQSGEISRPIMWRGAWKLFLESPAWGTGAGSYNVLFEKHRPERFVDNTLWAHNEYLNTLSDYGAVGVGLLLATVGWGGWKCFRSAAVGRGKERNGSNRRMHWLDDPLTVQGMGIGLLAMALQFLVDFHLKIPATAMVFAAVAALWVGRVWPVEFNRDASPGVAIRGVSLGCGVLSVLVGAVFVDKYRAEDLRFRARETIDLLAVSQPSPSQLQTGVLAAHTALRSAVVIDPGNGNAWSDLSYATSLRAHGEDGQITVLGREAEAAADHALSTSQVCSEFWIRRGVARDMQGRWLDATEDFTRAISIAPTSAPAWFYLADHYSRNATTRGMTGAALEFCLRLDPGNHGGLALRQRLAIKSK